MAIPETELLKYEAKTAAIVAAAWPYLNTMTRKNILEHGQTRYPRFFELLATMEQGWTGDVTVSPLDAAKKALARLKVDADIIDVFLQTYLETDARNLVRIGELNRPAAASAIQTQTIKALQGYLEAIYLEQKDGILKTISQGTLGADKLPIKLAETLRPYQIEDDDEPNTIEELEELMASGEADEMSYVISTGFNSLDAAIEGGLKPKRMTLMEAERGTGKTSIALQIVLEAVKQDRHCLVMSLEMSRSDMMKRMLVQAYGVSKSLVEDLMRNRSLSDEMIELRKRIDRLVKFIDFQADSPDSVYQIPIMLEDFRRVYGVYPELVSVDYIQNMATEEDSTRQLTAISKTIFEFAKRFNTHFIVNSQVKDGRAYGATAMEDAPDLVLLLKKDESCENGRVIESRKNRFGPPIKVELDWYGYINTLRERGQAAPPTLVNPVTAGSAHTNPMPDAQPTGDAYTDIPF